MKQIITRIIIAFCLVLAMPLFLHAQTDASGISFSAGSEAIALHYNGSWYTGTHVTETLSLADFGSTKANHLYLEGHEIVASDTAGFNLYAGGVRFEPNLTSILSKTNIPSDSFGVYVNAALGNATLATGGSHMSAIVGGGVKYKLTSSLTWSALHANWVRVGNMNGTEMSTGLTYVFGKN